MATKQIYTRVQNKHDLEVNWHHENVTFVPMKGELIIYDIEVNSNGNALTLPAGRSTPYTYERFKIGDGIHIPKELPFATDHEHSDYITEAELNKKNYLTAIPDTEANQLSTLWSWYNNESFSIKSLTPSTTTLEMGSTKNITFSWEFSTTPVTVTFNGVSQAANATGSYTISNITSKTDTKKTYTLSGANATGGSVTKSCYVYFRNKYYYGYSAATALDNTTIKALGNSGWASSNTTSFTSSCPGGQYVYYAYPSRLGTSEMWSGGFQGGFEAPSTISVTNNSGVTESYYVYRSTNTGATGTIEAK